MVWILTAVTAVAVGCAGDVDVTAIHYTVRVGDGAPADLDTVWIRVLDPDQGSVIEPAEQTTVRMDLDDNPLPRTGLVYPGTLYREAVQLEALGLRGDVTVARAKVRAEFSANEVAEFELVLAATNPEGDAEHEAADSEPDAELDLDTEQPPEPDAEPEPEPITEPDLPAEAEQPPDLEEGHQYPPEAVLAFQSPSLGQAPIRLDGRGSFDPDGQIMSYRFEFGDGTPDQDGALPEANHLYRCAGEYTVRLTVTDDDGLTDTAEGHLEIVPPVSDVDEDRLEDCTEEDDGWDWTDPNMFNGMELLVFWHNGRDECFWLTDLTKIWSEHVSGQSPLAQVRVTEGWLHLPQTDEPLVTTIPGLADSELDTGLFENVILVYRGRLKVPPSADGVAIDPRTPDDNLAVRFDGDWFLADESGIINCTWTENGGDFEVTPSSEHLLEIMIVNFNGPYGWDLKFQFNDGQDLTQRVLRVE